MIIAGSGNFDIETSEAPLDTYRVSNNQITSNLSGLEALKQSLTHFLNFQPGSLPTYPAEYGFDRIKYIDQDKDFVEAFILGDITESVKNWFSEVSSISLEETIFNESNPTIITFKFRIITTLGVIDYDITTGDVE